MITKWHTIFSAPPLSGQGNSTLKLEGIGMKDGEAAYVLLSTSDGRQYAGLLQRMSVGGALQELLNLLPRADQ